MRTYVKQSSTIGRATTLGMALLLMVGVGISVYAAFSPRFPGDLAIARWVQGLSAPWLDTAMELVTISGEVPVAIGSILAVAAGLFLARRWPEGVTMLGSLVLEAMLQVVKLAVDRPRPSEELVRVLESGSSGSFPSGHAYHAVLFGGLLLTLLVTRIRPLELRRAVALLVLVVISVIMVSRLYLGAHWPSDVLGSTALGIPSVAMLTYLCHHLKRIQERDVKEKSEQTS